MAQRAQIVLPLFAIVFLERAPQLRQQIDERRVKAEDEVPMVADPSRVTNFSCTKRFERYCHQGLSAGGASLPRMAFSISGALGLISSSSRRTSFTNRRPICHDRQDGQPTAITPPIIVATSASTAAVMVAEGVSDATVWPSMFS